MTEVEENLWECAVDGKTGEMTVTRDDGDSTSALDWTRLGEQWRDLLVSPVPQYELHHAVDLPFAAGESCRRSAPPLDLVVLCARAATEAGIASGGWFVFEKADRWAFRSNEFSNERYEACLERLRAQIPKLRAVVEDMLLAAAKSSSRRHGGGGGAETHRSFDTAASLEKVHAIWRM